MNSIENYDTNYDTVQSDIDTLTYVQKLSERYVTYWRGQN